MKSFTVISGKGGTGKTSIVSSFAALSGKVALADCDVDAADLHLVIPPHKSKRNSFSGSKVARINQDNCIQCGVCQELCKFEAINAFTDRTDPQKVVFEINPIACEGCGVCEWFCSMEAISLEEETNGEWFISETEYGPMVHARLGIAAENSGRLVTVVRNFAEGLGRARDLQYLIIDGPPGIGCPVIASITGVQYTLIITEPTLSGKHDLERILSLTKHFSIPTGVCINKWDLNPAISQEIEEWVSDNGSQVIGKIRFDHSVTQAQVKHIPVVSHQDNGVSGDIKELWQKVQNEIESIPDH